MSVPDKFAEVAERIVGFYEKKSSPPFLVYQYDPREEYTVRRELHDLMAWLAAPAQSIECATISLAEVFWEALEENGQLEQIAELERAGDYGDANLAVRQILDQPPTLTDRVRERVLDAGGDRSAVFLCRAAALYPAHRTSPLIDDLKTHVNRPVVMLFPGRLVGQYGLKFMGQGEPTYAYRALILPRKLS